MDTKNGIPLVIRPKYPIMAKGLLAILGFILLFSSIIAPMDMELLEVRDDFETQGRAFTVKTVYYGSSSSSTGIIQGDDYTSSSNVQACTTTSACTDFSFGTSVKVSPNNNVGRATFNLRYNYPKSCFDTTNPISVEYEFHDVTSLSGSNSLDFYNHNTGNWDFEQDLPESSSALTYTDYLDYSTNLDESGGSTYFGVSFYSSGYGEVQVNWIEVMMNTVSSTTLSPTINSAYPQSGTPYGQWSDDSTTGTIPISWNPQPSDCPVSFVQYKWGSGSWNYVPVTSGSNSANIPSKSFTSSDCGINTLTVKLKDQVGNVGTATDTHSFYYDGCKPNGQSHTLLNTNWFNGQTSITLGGASDPHSGFSDDYFMDPSSTSAKKVYDTTSCSVSTANGITCGSWHDVTSLACGITELWAFPLDNVENMHMGPARIDIKSDDCAPDQSQLDPSITNADYWFTTSSPTLTWQTANDCSSSEDCVGGVEYQLTGDVQTNTTSTSYDTSSEPSLGEGVHQVSITTCDGLSNCGSATSSSFRIDTKAPEMPGPSSSSITSESGWSNDPNFWVVIGADDSNSAANNGEVSGVETIHLKMSQESSVAKSDSGWINTSCLNGQGAASAECSGRQVTYDMSSVGSGVAYAFYYATDVAGNEPSESELLPSIIYDISFQFDFDAPHGDLAPVIGNIGSSGYLESSTAELSWNAASDEQIGIDVSGIEGYAVAVNDLPTSPLSDVNHPETWDEVNGFQDGTNRICVSAIDVAGNNGSWHCTADFEYDAAQFDTDDDGFSDADDNCPTAPNPNQVDSDEDGIGDACEADSDYDGIIDDEDNCVNEQNVDQSDFNSDGIGDACSDIDEDGVSDADDNCRQDGNADQLDGDGDGIGDICDDSDDDGAMDAVDNCPYHPNSSQEDEDSDGVGDACEGAPADGDGDGVPDIDDNCPSTPNSNQEDTDSDGVGDACDSVSGGSSGGNSAPAAVDIKNPSPNSFYSQSELSQLSLEWWSATDDIEVVGYRIQFDELGWRNVSQSQLSYPFPLLEDDAQHRVQIYAVDADGLSGPTSSVTFSICPDEASANDDHTGCQSSSGHASTIGWNLETLMGGGILILLGVMIYLWGMRRR